VFVGIFAVLTKAWAWLFHISRRLVGHHDATPKSEIIPSPDDLLDMKAVRAMTGNRGTMTLYRWQRDENIRFPLPNVVIGRCNFWRRRTISEWVDRLEAQQAAAKPSAART
jgi:predicted DNA-binding transcriptional regulator AlpA